jgi:AcrR family transcriptional regulator
MSTDKKTLIYEAVLSLVYEHNDLSRIKVADIAERANIGKGTVYEYFQSKEQAIGEALIYMYNKGLESFARLLGENRGFQETYYTFLRNFRVMLSKNRHVYNFMTMNPANFSVHATIQAIIHPSLKKLKKRHFELVEKLVERSINEGIIKANPQKFDWQAAILSSLTCIYLHQQFPDDSLRDEEVLDKAYAAYVKLLN